MSALVFLDTETTGLDLSDDIWEFAAIRREADGTETETHLFIDHSLLRCARLPASFLADHLARFPQHDLLGRFGLPPGVVSKDRACRIMSEVMSGAHIVGAVPNFDTERIALMLARDRWPTDWHYHLIDVENLAVGWIHGRYGTDSHGPLEAEGDAVQLPWDSDKVAGCLGVTINEAERHTAMGDARWAMRIYDAVTGRAS